MTALAPDADSCRGLRFLGELVDGYCETFGAEIGQRFAKAWVDFFNCRAAGHTYIIGPFQSGLHILKPGEEPNWSPWEGLKDGTPAAPKHALWSRPSVPNTITCLHGRIPFVS